jgi:DNA-directed RNA polymerase specialized sigma24 family protein
MYSFDHPPHDPLTCDPLTRAPLTRDPLTEWAIAASCHPIGSVARQKLLTQLVSAVQQSGRLWRGGGVDRDDYDEALQKTWLYVCRSIEKYDPDRAEVMTWINNHLQWRLRDIPIAQTKTQKHIKSLLPRNTDEDSQAQEDPIHQIPARSEPSSLLSDLQEWLEQEALILQRVHIQHRPELHCQKVIHQRLLLECPWKELSLRHNCPVPTLSNFYQKKCLPFLRQFMQDQGYID